MTALGFLFLFLYAQAAPPSTGAGRITGRVVADGTGAPIEGARVSLFSAVPPRDGTFRQPAEAITDRDGRFSLDRLATADYYLDVQKTGFVSYPGGAPGVRRQAITVAAGQAIDGVEVRLLKGGVIAGRLLQASGEPAIDVSVTALIRTQIGRGAARYIPSAGPSHQTDDLGQFRIAGLASGDYIVVARARAQFASPFGRSASTPPPSSGPRTTSATTYYPGTIDQGSAQAITVAAGQTVENIVFSMLTSPAFRVSGVVVDENGAAVAGAMVMLMVDPRSGALMGPSGNARTQDDGTFVLVDVPPGSYRINASVPVTVRSGTASDGGSVTTWSSSGGSGGVTSGVVSGGAPPSMQTDVVVADSDVAGVRVVVHR